MFLDVCRGLAGSPASLGAWPEEQARAAIVLSPALQDGAQGIEDESVTDLAVLGRPEVAVSHRLADVDEVAVEPDVLGAEALPGFPKIEIADWSSSLKTTLPSSSFTFATRVPDCRRRSSGSFSNPSGVAARRSRAQVWGSASLAGQSRLGGEESVQSQARSPDATCGSICQSKALRKARLGL